MTTGATLQFGAVDLPVATYMRRLKAAIDRPVEWMPFHG
jgi:hypothetical protein